MKKRSVYVLQESRSVAEELADSLREYDFEIAGTSCDGLTAIAEIEKTEPEYLITGIISFTLDGLEVIKRLKAAKNKIKIIVVSAITREEVIQRAMDLGAEYYMVKPIDKSVLADRLNELGDKVTGKTFRNDEKRSPNIDEKISKIFISVGIPPHIKGYVYLREGVKMAIDKPQIINNITKQLYPGIGEKYSTSASKVERAIRHAIEVAWNRGRIESINSVFGVRAYVGSEKPTNGEFIALVADKMILEGA
ncbi:MAG: sporulation transcription factor Spo0A [Clostridia bacterium]|nr:sporulation transcription factor Spo0A [Clostridia bacterium]